jgi:hypothetical protein
MAVATHTRVDTIGSGKALITSLAAKKPPGIEANAVVILLQIAKTQASTSSADFHGQVIPDSQLLCAASDEIFALHHLIDDRRRIDSRMRCLHPLDGLLITHAVLFPMILVSKHSSHVCRSSCPGQYSNDQ